MNRNHSPLYRKIVKFIHFKLFNLSPKWFGIERYEKDKGKYDVQGSVDLRYWELEELPYNFGIIHGNFYCSYNKLKTLKGSPTICLSSFDCSFNNLESLEFSPLKITDWLNCSNNKISSILNCPNVSRIDFENNNLSNLDGLPMSVRYIVIRFNPIIKLGKEIEYLNRIDISREQNFKILSEVKTNARFQAFAKFFTLEEYKKARISFNITNKINHLDLK